MLSRVALTSLAATALAMGFISDVRAQVAAPYQNREERELYNTSPGAADSGTILDATNPMDLLNRIRQSGAMNDATTPSDAIDAALKAYQNDPVSPPQKTAP